MMKTLGHSTTATEGRPKLPGFLNKGNDAHTRTAAATGMCRLVSAAAARDYACSAFSNPAACNYLAPSALMCSWGISSGPGYFNKGCRSTYMAEWDAFASQPLLGAGDAPRAAQAIGHVAALMCPGSIAHKSQSCSNIYREWLPSTSLPAEIATTFKLQQLLLQ